MKSFKNKNKKMKNSKISKKMNQILELIMQNHKKILK
jgi:hypothetical protein